jgi:hypothetical protein
MNISDVKISYIKYKMSRMSINIPSISTAYEINSNHISNIIIEKDYDNYMFPFFQIDVLVPNYIYRAMKKQNQELRAFVDLQYGQFKEPDYSIAENPPFTSYVTDNFYIFMEDTTPEIMETILEQRQKDDNTFGKGMDLSDATLVKLLLYKEEYLFRSKAVVNAVLTSATLVDALTYVLNKSQLNNVLLSPPNNYKLYNEFIITPIIAMEQIERICNEFGMHTYGSLIFFDFRNIYIIDKTSKCTAYVQNEFKTTYIMTCPITSQASTLLKGYYSNPVEKYNLLNLDPYTIKIKDYSGISDQLYGNDFINIDINSGNIKTVNSDANKSIGSLSSPTRVLVTTKGEDTSSAIKQQMYETSKIISASFSYVNINALNPNKEFVFSTDDTKFIKYAGKYRITKNTCILQKEGEYFVPHVVAEFKGGK